MIQPNLIYVTTLDPSEIGHGGVHRSYQILSELQEIAGPEQVLLFTKCQLLAATAENEENPQRHSQPGNTKLKQWASYRAGTAKRLIKNPYRLIQRTQFATGTHPDIRNYYEAQVRNLGGAVCVLEHAEFADLIPINQKYKIPTISCTQNFDALGQNFELLSRHLSALRSNDNNAKYTVGFYAAMMDFANELQILAQCDERLFISKLEAGVVGGLGLTALYYPYLPVGGIRRKLMSIREKRARSKKEQRLFVLIGTAMYGPIKESCQWLIGQVRNEGLPAGVRIIVVGAGTDSLLPQGESVPGIEVKGWLEQNELDELLTRAAAVLIPQRFGFGAPTRMAELSCANVPMIGDRHPTYAIDPPPGFHGVDPSWTAWCEKMLQLSDDEYFMSENDYGVWEANQPRPLAKVVKRMLR